MTIWCKIMFRRVEQLINNMYMLQERLFDQSDAYRVHVCEQCGMIAIANLKKNQFHCPACKTSSVVQVFMPYACKLLFQELMAMAIAPRLQF